MCNNTELWLKKKKRALSEKRNILNVFYVVFYGIPPILFHLGGCILWIKFISLVFHVLGKGITRNLMAEFSLIFLVFHLINYIFDLTMKNNV